MKLGMLISDLERSMVQTQKQGFIFFYCRGSISQSEILLLIKYFALDDNKTLHIFRLAQQDTP